MKLTRKMVKKTNFLLFSLIAALVVSPAYSVTVTKTYVDKQDKSLQSNILLLRDMLNTKDSSGAWLTLDTEAQLAIPAINELKAALDAKANVDDVATTESLTELNDAVAALESGKATVADLQALQSTVDTLGDTYATDAEVSSAIADVQSAIDNIDLSAYVKTADLAAVATSGQYADLEGKPEIPSIAGLATTEELTNLQTTLQAAIDAKQAKGEYLVAADLNVLNNQVAALQTDKADLATVAEIQTTLSKLGETYATDAELTAAIEAVKLLIPTIPTNVSAFENDAGYITATALTPYAKSADAEMVANKVSSATAEQIDAMSSSEKESKYPSISVTQTIANSAVTKVSEVAGDVLTLKTQVDTNTADIAELDKTVADVSVVAYAAIPAPSEECKAVSGACALSSDTNGNLTWVMIANSLTDVQ